MNWKKPADRTYTTVTKVTFRSLFGSTRTIEIAFRIDGRDGLYRVDTKTSAYEPWEAIDGGEGFRTVKLAKAYASRWLKAANTQATLSPHIPRAA